MPFICSVGIIHGYTLSALIICLIASVIVMNSVCNGASAISNSQDQIENTTSDQGAEMNRTYKYSLLKDGVFEGDIVISEELIRLYYNLSSIPGGEKYYELVSKEQTTL